MTMTPTHPDWLTTVEVAQLADLKPSTIRRYLGPDRRGGPRPLPLAHHIGRTLVWDRDEVERWLGSRA